MVGLLGCQGVIQKVDSRGAFLVAVGGNVHLWASSFISPIVSSSSSSTSAIPAIAESNKLELTKATRTVNSSQKPGMNASSKSSKAMTKLTELDNHIQIISAENLDSAVGAFRFMHKLLKAILDNPNEMKYRKINTSKAKLFKIFGTKVENFFLSLGFLRRQTIESTTLVLVDRNIPNVEKNHDHCDDISHEGHQHHKLEGGIVSSLSAAVAVQTFDLIESAIEKLFNAGEMGHLGEYRDLYHDQHRYRGCFCARDATTKFGSRSLCEHIEGDISMNHWSCCGHLVEGSRLCLNVSEQKEMKTSVTFRREDIVRIRYDLCRNEALAVQGYLGLTESMARQLGSVGIVTAVSATGGVIDVMVDGGEHHWSPAMLQHDSIASVFRIEDEVLIRSLPEEIAILAHQHIYYDVLKRKQYYGCTGVVVGSPSWGYYIVDCNGVELCWNSVILEPACLVPGSLGMGGKSNVTKASDVMGEKDQEKRDTDKHIISPQEILHNFFRRYELATKESREHMAKEVFCTPEEIEGRANLSNAAKQELHRKVEKHWKIKEGHGLGEVSY